MINKWIQIGIYLVLMLVGNKMIKNMGWRYYQLTSISFLILLIISAALNTDLYKKMNALNAI